MTTLTANELEDKDRVWNTWELPYWAKVKVECKKQWEEKPYQSVAIFKKMDWMYWLWSEEWTDEPLIFRGKFRHIDWDLFELID